MTIRVDHILDAKGLACPMPIVKTKQKMEQLLPGQVLEVQATVKAPLRTFKVGLQEQVMPTWEI